MFWKGEVARVPLRLDVLLTKKMGKDIRVPLGKEGCPLIATLLYAFESTSHKSFTLQKQPENNTA